MQAPRLASNTARVFAVGDEAGLEAEADTSADVYAAAANRVVAEPGFDPGTFGL